MKKARWFSFLAAAVLVASGPVRAETDEARLFRIFLADGHTLVSYGEFARVGDRVVFSLPLGSQQESPRLHLISIPALAIDWSTTHRYSESARHAHYVSTRAETDYGLMNGQVAQTLNQIALTPDPVRRLALAEGARRVVAGWPAAHFGYRAPDVRQMMALLDEVIYELRAAIGMRQFEVSLVATMEEPPRVPLLPAPGEQQAIEQVLTAVRLVETAAERISLLRSAAALIDESAARLPAPFVTTMRLAVKRRLDADLATDRTYADLTRIALKTADTHAARADVRAVEAVLRTIVRRDEALGRRRPHEVAALVAAVESRLEMARRLRLERDLAAERQAVARAYGRALGPALTQLRAAWGPLDDIRAMAGPTQTGLATLDRRLGRARRAMGSIAPPRDVQAIHGTFLTALQLADHAVSLRTQAIRSGSLRLAHDASSAAAGALMLVGRAREDLDRFAR